MDNYIILVLLCVILSLILILALSFIIYFKKQQRFGAKAGNELQNSCLNCENLSKKEKSIVAARKEDSKQTLEILEKEYGIVVSPIKPKALEKQGFQPVSSDIFARISGAMQPMTGVMFTQMMEQTYQKAYAGAYRIWVPAGCENAPRMKIQRMIEESGGSAESLEFIGPGGVRRHGGVQKIDPPNVRAQKLAHVAFSAASVVTNQYFLYCIDKKLSAIQQTTTAILHFLELDKQSKLQGCWDYLSERYSSLNSILNNNELKQATLNQVQDIKKHVLGDIQFYRTTAQESLDVFSGKLSKFFKFSKDLAKSMEEVKNHISSYWFATYVYQLAVMLEILLTQNYDSDYLRNIQSDLIAQTKKYEELYQKYLELYRSGAWEGIGKNFFDYHWKDILALDPDMRSEYFDKINKKESAFVDIIEDYQPLRDIRPAQLMEVSDSLKTLEEMFNSPLELAVSDGQAYIRLPEYWTVAMGSKNGPDVELQMLENE